MIVKIAEKEATLRQELKPADELESSAITELARATVQHHQCDDQVYINEERARQSVDISWDDDQRAYIDTVAARLRKAPDRVAHELERNLHGAEYCLRRWTGLRDALGARGELTEDQRLMCFDLLGVPEVLRDGSRRVPAAKDAEGLKALIAGQIERLQTRIDTVLKDRDLQAQDEARLGIPRVLDSQTRRVRSNAARAYKRYLSALDVLKEMLAARAAAVAARPAARPAQAPPPAPPTAAPPTPSAAASTASTPHRSSFAGPVGSRDADAERERAERRAERIRRNSPATAADAQRATAATGGPNAAH
jgi:hypothetical protein